MRKLSYLIIFAVLFNVFSFSCLVFCEIGNLRKQFLNQDYQLTNCQITPNELGKIAVLTYHQVGVTDGYFVRNRTKFLNDLYLLKEKGFYTIKTLDFLNGIIKVPKGKKPIILSFDDSFRVQFEMDITGKIKPDSAIGMMEDFKMKNPDFPVHAIFFVPANAFFGQPKFVKEKMEFLVQNGYEIGNHTYQHTDLRKFPESIQKELALCQRSLYKYLPDYTMYAMATPFGAFPPKQYLPRLIQGAYGGYSYQNKIIFDYSNQLSLSPFDINFNTFKVHRIQGFESNIAEIIKEMEMSDSNIFISDGDEKRITIRKVDENLLHPKWREKFRTEIVPCE